MSLGFAHSHSGLHGFTVAIVLAAEGCLSTAETLGVVWKPESAGESSWELAEQSHAYIR